MEYRHLIQDPKIKAVWNPEMSTEVYRFIDTETTIFLKKKNIPLGETAVYTILEVDLRPNKAVHEILRMCMGGDRMESVMETTTRTADLTTCKLHMNGVVSTPGARFADGDIKYFYLNTPLKKKRYGKVKAKYIPEETIEKHQLEQYIEDYGWLHFEIGKGMYGIPEAGRLANDLLRARLKKYGYIKATHTPGYWKHLWKPISWMLIVDDFGFKYTNTRHMDELLKITSQWYIMKMDWPGTSFGGITLKWNYDGERWVELSFPGYIQKILTRFRHPQLKRPHDSPHPDPPTKFTRTTPTPPSLDKSPRLDKKGIKRVQQICGSILWYMWACDITTTKALNANGREQAKATETTRTWANW